MCRAIGLNILSLCICLLAGLCPAHGQVARSSENFSFWTVTDTHQTAEGANQALQNLIRDAVSAVDPPAFLIDTGDVTEAGLPAEFARFKEAITGLKSAGIGFYATPGNHDVRWCPEGKEAFTREFGRLYQSFDHRGVHFVLLDSTVLLEHWGHFDKAQLDWLQRDMKRVKPDTPVFLFMHHFPGRSAPDSRMIDNQYSLLAPLRGHNVLAIFTGHGHQDLVWKFNGVTTLMSRGLYQGSHYRIHVTPALVTIERMVKEKPGVPITIATLPVARKARPSALRAGWDDPDVPFLERRRPGATLVPRAVTDNPEMERAEYRIDSGVWKPMQRDARDVWRDQFATKGIPVGMHTTEIQLTTSNGVTYQDELIFEVERERNEPTRKWAVNLDGAIQSSPLRTENALYVSCLDGKLYALDVSRGKRRWTLATRGPLLASPVLAGDTLYIGSADHFFYAVDTAGRQRWKYDTGSPVFATAAVARGVVCVGTSGKILGLDAQSGRLKWSQPAGSFFQSRAATDGESFYLGGWDNTLYAVDAATGTLRWTLRMGTSFYYSPAVSSPTLAEGRLYICSLDNRLHAVDTRSGREEWAVQPPANSDKLGYSTPAFTGPHVIVAGLGEKGDLFAFDARDGRLAWHTSLGQNIYDSSPRLAPDGRTFAIMGQRGRVAVLETVGGRKLWTYELGPGNIFSTPEYDGTTVYTATMANDVQALNAPGPQLVRKERKKM